MDVKQAKDLITRLIDAAYDTGYYSGKGEDGMYHYLSAINAREDLRLQVIHHLTNKSSRQDITKPLKVKVQTKKLKRWKPSNFPGRGTYGQFNRTFID